MLPCVPSALAEHCSRARLKRRWFFRRAIIHLKFQVVSVLLNSHHECYDGAWTESDTTYHACKANDKFTRAKTRRDRMLTSTGDRSSLLYFTILQHASRRRYHHLFPGNVSVSGDLPPPYMSRITSFDLRITAGQYLMLDKNRITINNSIPLKSCLYGH